MNIKMESQTVLVRADIDFMEEAKSHLLWLGQHALDCGLEESTNVAQACDCGLHSIISQLTIRIEESNSVDVTTSCVANSLINCHNKL